jgi:hypothetical protein
MTSSTHALFIPYPAQGHVLPLLELAHRFADHGFAVTFVNTDHIHGQLVAASPDLLAGQDGPPPESGQVRLVSVSDGFPPDGDRNDLGTLTSALMSSLPAAVEHMIQNGQFRCMVVDYGLAWVLGVAKKAGMRCRDGDKDGKYYRNNIKILISSKLLVADPPCYMLNA